MNSAIYDDFAVEVSAFAITLSPPLPVSYPGLPFTPPASGYWLEVQWFPNETQNYGIAFDGPSVLRGFGQVSVCTRPGTGLVKPMDLAGLVIETFDKGTRIGDALVYRKPWASSVIQDNERLMIPVTIMWQAGDG